MRIRQIVALVVVLAMTMAACGGGSDGDDSATATPVDPGSLALSGEAAAGLTTFQAKCVSCHRNDLTGGTGPALGPGSNAAGKTAGDLRGTIVGGGSGMPSWGGLLSDGEIDGLIVYLLAAQGR